jgi:hypothetical protein
VRVGGFLMAAPGCAASSRSPEPWNVVTHSTLSLSLALALARSLARSLSRRIIGDCAFLRPERSPPFARHLMKMWRWTAARGWWPQQEARRARAAACRATSCACLTSGRWSRGLLSTSSCLLRFCSQVHRWPLISCSVADIHPASTASLAGSTASLAGSTASLAGSTASL